MWPCSAAPLRLDPQVRQLQHRADQFLLPASTTTARRGQCARVTLSGGAAPPRHQQAARRPCRRLPQRQRVQAPARPSRANAVAEALRRQSMGSGHDSLIRNRQQRRTAAAAEASHHRNRSSPPRVRYEVPAGQHVALPRRHWCGLGRRTFRGLPDSLATGPRRTVFPCLSGEAPPSLVEVPGRVSRVMLQGFLCRKASNHAGRRLRRDGSTTRHQPHHRVVGALRIMER